MTIQLMGEVGRSGRPEDVAVVQALLANIKGPSGRPFWETGIDGRAGDGLAVAIEACQRFWGRALIDAGSSETAGVVRPGSRTLDAFEALAPGSFHGLRTATTAPPIVLYATDDPRGRAARNLQSERSLSGATHWNLSAIRQGLHHLAHRDGIAVAVRRSGLAGDRWGFRVAPEGMTVVEADGRGRQPEDRPESVPGAIWRLVDAEFGRLFEAVGGGEMTGPGVYRSRTPLASLARGGIDETILVRMEVPRPARHESVRLASAALGLIVDARSLTRERQDELRQIIAMVESEDPATARLLEERWRSMRNGISSSSLRYATREQIREYLKQQGQYEAVLRIAGLVEVVAGGLSGPNAALQTLAELLADGAEAEAERLYEARQKIAQASTTSIAGTSVPQDASRRAVLLGLFGIDPARFRLEPGPENELLDLMERILELHRTGRAGARAVGDEIYERWGRYWFLDRLLGVYRQAADELTNPVNASYRPDDQLAAYRTRMVATKMVVEVVGDAGTAFGIAGNVVKPRDGRDWGLFGEFLLWVLENEHERAVRLAKDELQRREALL